VLIVAAVWWEQVESVLNDFVRLREESSYHDSGMTVEAGAGMAELLADDEENYQLGATGAGAAAAVKAIVCVAFGAIPVPIPSFLCNTCVVLESL